jgi:hypothetical protein
VGRRSHRDKVNANIKGHSPMGSLRHGI